MYKKKKKNDKAVEKKSNNLYLISRFCELNRYSMYIVENEIGNGYYLYVLSGCTSFK